MLIAVSSGANEVSESLLSAEDCSQMTMDDKINEMTNVQNSDKSLRVQMETDTRLPRKDHCRNCVEKMEIVAAEIYHKHQRQIWLMFKVVIFLIYMLYFVYCMYLKFGDEGSIFLLAATVIVLLFKCKQLLNSKERGCSLFKYSKVCSTQKSKRILTFVRYGLYVVSLTGLALYFGIDIFANDPRNSQSLLGIVSFILICYILSTKPSRVDWHPVFYGFVLQFLFAIFTLRTSIGYFIFQRLGQLVNQLVDFSDTGGVFVLGKNFKEMGLGLSITAVIIFFNSVIYLLIHWGILQAFVVYFGHAMSSCLNTGPVESVIAVANIFIGLSEAPLLIKSYLPTLSRSEICAVMTCGFASISGGTMAMFISFGAPPNHLLTAAVISAPAALAFAKLICPETHLVNLEAQKDIQMTDQTNERRNALSAAAEGAVSGVKIVVSAMANMLAFICILRMMDACLNWLAQRAGLMELNFTMVCSYLLYPLAYIMGSDPSDCGKVAALIGVKLFATPMVAYSELGKMIKNRHVFESYMLRDNSSQWYWQGNDVILVDNNMTLINGFMSERSEVITTYAMCGYSAFTAIGVTLGTLIALCPSRKDDFIRMVLTAFFAGNIASFATGSVAGLLYTDHS